ncbi:aspartate carbamoyltransferase [Methylomonas koyamae]|uniref:aspartate carbamoyltransferase n=1 Tax=Methylomonas koyamae TaxID=702114 RepID=UPI00287397C0|nr:aspartate carbamoyltransferase [Methylomonas koyamae]WNB78065.1 aspartate carbamoyltransferase [Methylomonas koyamae]
MSNFNSIATAILLFCAAFAATAAGETKPAYSPDNTVQTFSKTVHGGVQHVVVKAGADAKLTDAIQAHLRQLAGAFASGDFSATERIHGAAMPGLATLKSAKPDEIRYQYRALPNGAQIHYSSEYPQLVQALHEWFDAQTSAHGAAAVPGHQQHHAAPAQ